MNINRLYLMKTDLQALVAMLEVRIAYEFISNQIELDAAILKIAQTTLTKVEEQLKENVQ